MPLVPERRVVVATKNIAAGELLTAPSLTTINISGAEALVGVFNRPQDLAGRVLLVPVSSGELLSAHDLVNTNTKDALTAGIPNGMRAISIPAVDQSPASSKLMTPGSHVDILVSYRSDTEATFVSSMVLQDVPVLASGRKGSTEVDTKPFSNDNMELLVTPEEAARLTVASSLGKLTFALRNGTDRMLLPGLSHVTLTPPQYQAHRPRFSPLVQQKASSEQPSRSFLVETLSGGKVSAQTFSGGQQ
jgi:pilus assembly protein CpaB